MRALWLEQSGDDLEDAAAPLRGQRKADVCIVGGGFTGLWTAVQVKSLAPSSEVVLVEADICGGGASGRNGGFLLTWAAKYLTLEKLFGAEDAVALLQLCERAPAAIAEFCEDHGIDARVKREGWLWTASNPAQLGAWNSTKRALERRGLDLIQDMKPAEIERLTGSSRHLDAAFLPNSATVEPGRLVRGLRRVAMNLGVEIFEHSPMRRLRRGASPGIETAEGSIAAERVVLATNAWTSTIPELRRRMVVVGSDVVATRPMPEKLAEFGLDHGAAISDSRLFTHYYRSSADGRLIFGKGGGDFVFGSKIGQTFEGESAYRKNIEAVMQWFYPSLVRGDCVQSWSGPIDRSMTGLPMFGELRSHPGVFYGVGYSGNGVGPTYVGGRILASLAIGRQDEWSEAPLVGARCESFPPEPLRYVGARVIKGALMRKERAEDRGGEPRKLDVALSALMPGGLVPVEKGKSS